MPQESELIIAHLPCPDVTGCGSSDAFALYDDQHGYCHSCNTDFQPRKLASLGYEVDPDAVASDKSFTQKDRSKMSEDLAHLIDSSSIQNLPKRGISQATCEHWDYRVRINSHGEGEHIATYRDEHGSVIAAKVRNLGKDGTGKDFRWEGDAKAAGLYGLHALGKGGKMLVVTEGEIDCLTASQLWHNKFPVVSVPNGAANAKKDIAKHLEVLSQFDRVVFAFDMDEPGRKAAVDCAKLLAPGKAAIAVLPEKDINAMHLKGLDTQITGLLHNAPEYKPPGIISGRDLVAQAMEAPAWGLRFGIDFLDNLQWGWRDGEVVVFGAGSGMGKSDVMYQVAAYMMREENVPCGILNFEATSVRILKGIAGKNAKKRFTVPDPDGLYWTRDDLEEALRLTTEVYAQPYINENKGSSSWESVKERTRYLVHAHGVKRVFVDPMAALAAGMEDERKGLDLVMAEAVSLCEELHIGMWFNSHLARPSDGNSHEEGGRVTLRNFRGSGAITMWAALVVGFERDQQNEDESLRHTSIMRALKVREAGENTGRTAAFAYNTLNGDLEPKDGALEGEGLSSSESPPEASPADLSEYDA